MDRAGRMSSPSNLRRMGAATIPFVLARRKENGGFGATPKLPATIQDTYHALHILRLADRCGAAGPEVSSLPREGRLQAYLADRLLLLSTTGASTAFQLLWSCQTAGVETARKEVVDDAGRRLQASDTLIDLYACTRIVTELLHTEPDRFIPPGVAAAILARPWRCVAEVRMHCYLADVLGLDLPFARTDLVAWLQACQNGDGGFGFFPGTTSFVENSRACLQTLAALGASPGDPEGAALFLAGCQTAGGGFGRTGRAAPFLDATWHALAAYRLLCPATS